MNVIVPNPEEAANVASEFIYSIDNLPGEVAHILQEIRHREARTQELQQEIDKDAAKYIRHARRASSASATMPMTTTMTASTGSNPSNTPVPESPSNSSSRAESAAPNGTPIPIPTKITASYTEIHELAAEKCALAERLIEIISRTRAKLDVDIAKVRLLQGDPPELVAAQASATANMKPAGMVALTTTVPLTPGGGSVGAEAFGAPGRNPALAISESLRNALAIPPVGEGIVSRGSGSAAVSGTTTPTGSSGHANKKRRTTTTTSIKISPAASPTKNRSASPSVAPVTTHTTQKSRLSRQVHPPPPPEDTDMDADADGDEDDGEMEEENEDETLYCFCQKQSYGDMIACDNEGGCPYEWFHLACVGLKQPTPEKWFCSACSKDKGLTTPAPAATRKGRKK